MPRFGHEARTGNTFALFPGKQGYDDGSLTGLKDFLTKSDLTAESKTDDLRSLHEPRRTAPYTDQHGGDFTTYAELLGIMCLV
jgi:hypothetical protein